MKEVKVLHCEFRDFESEANEMLRQGWDVVGFHVSPGFITGLFIRDFRDVTPPTPPTPPMPIPAAPDGQTFVERLRWLRAAHGWPIYEAARYAGIPSSQLSDLERGRTLPSLATLYKLADAYNMTASELLCGVVLEASDESEAGRDDE